MTCPKCGAEIRTGKTLAGKEIELDEDFITWRETADGILIQANARVSHKYVCKGKPQ